MDCSTPGFPCPSQSPGGSCPLAWVAEKGPSCRVKAAAEPLFVRAKDAGAFSTDQMETTQRRESCLVPVVSDRVAWAGWPGPRAGKECQCVRGCEKNRTWPPNIKRRKLVHVYCKRVDPAKLLQWDLGRARKCYLPSLLLHTHDTSCHSPKCVIRFEPLFRVDLAASNALLTLLL